MLMLDINKAYDTVDREILREKIKVFCGEENKKLKEYLNLIIDIYDNIKYEI